MCAFITIRAYRRHTTQSLSSRDLSSARQAIQTAADHYRVDLANVHGAMDFFYDNEAAINEAIREARKPGDQLGAVCPRGDQGT